jgi:hypothetical protein
LAEGLKLLFVTEIPPAGGVVFPVGWLLGAVEPPDPPHAPTEIKASATHTFLVLMTFAPLRVLTALFDAKNIDQTDQRSLPDFTAND